MSENTDTNEDTASPSQPGTEHKKEPIAEPVVKQSHSAPAEASGAYTEEDSVNISSETSKDGKSADPDQPEHKSKKEAFKAQISEGTHKVADMSKKAAEVTGDVLNSSYQKVKEYNPKTSIHILDRFLNWVRAVCPPEIFDSISTWCAKYGHAGIVAAQILVLIFSVIKAFQSGWSFLFHGIGIALLLVILQYTADKFLHAGQRFINSTPSRLSSPAFLDCAALLLEIGGLLIFLSMAANGWINALLGLAIWSLLKAIALTAVHPNMVNVSIAEDVTAGEEAIGILSFFAKSILKIVPIAYGVGSIFGTLALALATLSMLGGNPADAGNNAIVLIICFACLPFVSYVLFMAYHLMIDILQSILSVPRKLDELKK